jgi:hypothetical protein
MIRLPGFTAETRFERSRRNTAPRQIECAAIAVQQSGHNKFSAARRSGRGGGCAHRGVPRPEIHPDHASAGGFNSRESSSGTASAWGRSEEDVRAPLL